MGSVYLLYVLNNLLLMPLPVRKQVVPTVLFSTAVIILYYFYKETTYIAERVNTIISLLTLNLVGFTFSRLIGRYRRMYFLTLSREQEIRSRLEETLEKIKHLSGIVPICSHCLKIRDEGGYWQRTEQYIQEHSEAQFSHGICPDCAKEHYDVDG